MEQESSGSRKNSVKVNLILKDSCLCVFRRSSWHHLPVAPETEKEVELWAKDRGSTMKSSVSLDRKEVFSHVEQTALNLGAEGADLHRAAR